MFSSLFPSGLEDGLKHKRNSPRCMKEFSSISHGEQIVILPSDTEAFSREVTSHFCTGTGARHLCVITCAAAVLTNHLDWKTCGCKYETKQHMNNNH